MLLAQSLGRVLVVSGLERRRSASGALSVQEAAGGSESAHMCEVFFAQADSGTAMY